MRLNVPDPDVAFVRQVEELVPVPAAIAARAAGGDRRLHPDAAGRVLQGGGPLPGARRSGPDLEAAARRQCPRPGRVPDRPALAALQVAHPLELRQRRLAQRDHRRPGAGAAAPRATAGERGIEEGDLVELRNTRGSVRAWAHVTRGRPPRHAPPSSRAGGAASSAAARASTSSPRPTSTPSTRSTTWPTCGRRPRDGRTAAARSRGSATVSTRQIAAASAPDSPAPRRRPQRR